MNERLEQIEKILLANTSQIATLLEAQTRTQEQLDRLTVHTRASLEDLVNLGADAVEQAAENVVFIRGLQVENRRILRELRDQRRENT